MATPMSAKSPPASEPSTPETASSPAPGKSRQKMIVIAAILALLLGGGGAGGYFAWKASAAGEESEAPDTKVKTAKKPDKAKDGKKDGKKARDRKPPVFVPLEPFTVNLQSPSRDSYLQVGLVVEAQDSFAADAVKANLPVIRSAILLLLAGKTPEDLAKPEGKDRLAAEVLERVMKPQDGLAPLAGVERIHYSAFIIQ